MGVNVETGVYMCYVCRQGGDFIEFFQRRHSLTFSEAVQQLAARYNVVPPARREGDLDPFALAARNDALLAGYNPQMRTETREETVEEERVIDEEIVRSAHEFLLASEERMQFLAERRGLTRDTLVRWEIGHDGQRYYIPIRDADGDCVNIRRYKPNAPAQDKMISWRPGFGAARLWPEESLEAERVYLFEGEMDTLLMLQNGLSALTTTGGAGTWRDTWNERFRDKEVVITYDVDDAGRNGARAIAGKLQNIARSVKVVVLPLTEPVGADITDYIVAAQHAVADYLQLVEQTAAQTAQEAADAPRVAGEPVRLHLAQAGLAEYAGQQVQVNAMVSGKSVSPFLIPDKVRLHSCGLPDGVKMCGGCALARANTGGTLLHEMHYDSNEIIQFANVSEKEKTALIKEKAGVPTRCARVRVDVQQSLNLEAVQLIPEIDRSEGEHQYVTREAFYIVQEREFLQTNRSYVLTGVTVPDPKTQRVTHLFIDKVAAHSNIDRFELTPEIREQLRAFQPMGANIEALREKQAEIYDDIERVTRIYERRDLHFTVDLTFLSVLQFRFQGELLVRGWVESLIIGDSRTGKSTIVQRLLEHYGAGEMTSGENTSIAGLVGGLTQMGTNWVLRWGKIPLNDRRLLAIDEASNLPKEHIGRLSSMRSSGIAEITKIHTERTYARARAIWITNPRSTRTMREYSQGVLAVKEMIGEPSDIARFDLVCAVSSQDVLLRTINSTRPQTAPEKFTAGLCHQRVMWAWSRKPEHIEWEAGAEQVVLDKATDQGERFRYATDIPLVEPNEQRVKLARLAVATAMFFFSTDETGEKVVVRSEHVEFAYEFLEQLYAKDSLAYTEYSEMGQRRNRITNEEEVMRILRVQPNAMRQLMENEQFQQTDLMDVVGENDRNIFRGKLQTLVDAGFLTRWNNGKYVKTSGAIRWLRAKLDERREVDRPLTVPQEPEW